MTKTALLAVGLLLASCSSGGTKGTGSVSTTGTPDAQTVTIGMKNDLKFHPSEVDAKVGTVTFTVKNLEAVPHDFQFSQASLGQLSTVDGGTDKPLKVVFTQAGTFEFVCTFHPGMTGKVVVS